MRTLAARLTRLEQRTAALGCGCIAVTVLDHEGHVIRAPPPLCRHGRPWPEPSGPPLHMTFTIDRPGRDCTMAADA